MSNRQNEQFNCDVNMVLASLVMEYNGIAPSDLKNDLGCLMTEFRTFVDDMKKRSGSGTIASNYEVTWALLGITVRVMAKAQQTHHLHALPGFLFRNEAARVGQILKEKNASYGNTALAPVRVFARGSAREMIDVRIDDKISRILNKPDAFGEDAFLDLAGYLVLRLLALDDEAANLDLDSSCGP